MKRLLIAFGPLFSFLLVFITLTDTGCLPDTSYKFDGRPTMSQSENLIHTQLGEPVHYDIFVGLTKPELAKLRPFDKDDKRVRDIGGQPYMRSDLYMYYRERLNEHGQGD